MQAWLKQKKTKMIKIDWNSKLNITWITLVYVRTHVCYMYVFILKNKIIIKDKYKILKWHSIHKNFDFYWASINSNWEQLEKNEKRLMLYNIQMFLPFFTVQFIQITPDYILNLLVNVN